MGIRESAPVVQGYATSVVTPTRTLQILGIDPFSEAPFRPELTPGGSAVGSTLTQLLQTPNAVLMSQHTANALGVTLGQSFVVNIAERTQPMTLVGILTTADQTTTQALDDLLVTDIAVAQVWLGKVGFVDRIDLIIADTDAGTAMRQRIQATLPAGVRLYHGNDCIV
jgi:putative ABC transport system permease protein